MDTLSIKRIGLLMRREITNNGKIVLWAMLALFGFFSLLFLVWLFNVNIEDVTNPTRQYRWKNFYDPYYYGGIILLALLVIGMAFPDFRNKGRTITYLTLPASSLEKFISMWLLTSVGFLVVYHIGFYIFNFATMALMKGLGADSFFILPISWESLDDYLGVSFVVHSFFFLGAVIFKRVPVFFSTITLVVSLVLLILLVPIILSSIYPETMSLEFGNFYFSLKGQSSLGEYRKYYLTLSNSYLHYIFPVILWVSAYYKIKEKTVA